MTKRQTVVQITITYLLVLLPLLFVSFFVTQTLLRNVEQEGIDRINNQLNLVVQALDDDFFRYTEKSVGLLQLQPFSYGRIKGEPITQLETIDMLQKLRLFDDRVDEILVYFGEEYLYGNNGITSPNVYFQTTLRCVPSSTEIALDTLQSEDAVAIALDCVTGGPYVMYHIPVGHDVSGNPRSVQYLFNISDFERMFDSYLETDEMLIEADFGNLSLYFNTTNGSCVALSNEEAAFLFNSFESNGIKLEQGGSTANIRIWYDDIYQLQSYRKLRNTSLLILIVGLFMSTALSAVLTFSRMRSIKRLADNIVEKTISKSSKKIWARNEFDYIQALVDESIRDSSYVKQNATSYRRMMLQQVAVMIFQGVLRDWEEIQSLLLLCGTELCEEYFFLCGIRMKSAEDARRLAPYIQEDIHYFPDDWSAIILCSLRSYDYDQSQRRDTAKRFLASLDSIGIQCNQVVMSQVYTPISLANYAYLEICSIFEHVESGNNRIVCWEDLVTQQAKNNYQLSNEDLQQFFSAVEQKNKQQADRILERIFIRDTQKKSEEYIRYVRYMVVQALRLSSRSLDEKDTNPIQQKLDKLELGSGDFVEAVKDILKELCSEPDAIYRNMIEYVDRNFTRYDLSLDQLAQEANVSKSQMSKIFRQLTGSCYIDYVTNLRMEKARELLATTNLGVKDVFMKVGYIDSANASKKFKTIYDITPSAYRMQMRKPGNTKLEDSIDDL